MPPVSVSPLLTPPVGPVSPPAPPPVSPEPAAACIPPVEATVLLAPACSSFDMFRDYAHRAEVFRTAVQTMIANTSDRIPIDPEMDE